MQGVLFSLCLVVCCAGAAVAMSFAEEANAHMRSRPVARSVRYAGLKPATQTEGLTRGNNHKKDKQYSLTQTAHKQRECHDTTQPCCAARLWSAAPAHCIAAMCEVARAAPLMAAILGFSTTNVCGWPAAAGSVRAGVCCCSAMHTSSGDTTTAAAAVAPP